jgi:flagellar biosynthetic protein FliP
MLIAGLGVVAALAFVLGLGAVCLWALKRWGTGTLGARTRIPLEVVQRMPLGPKTGIAVVRIGEKVMAVSVGDGGIRPLFDLDEGDRQRVIASSTIPTPVVSSDEARAAFASLAPVPLGSRFGALLGRALKQPVDASAPAVHTHAVHTHAVHTHAVTPSPALTPTVTAPVMTVAPFTLTERAEIPSFLTAAPTTSRGAALTYAPPAMRAAAPAERDFRALLGVSLTGATRLAVFTMAMVLIGARGLQAQAAPPAVPPFTPPVIPAAPAPVVDSTAAARGVNVQAVNAAAVAQQNVAGQGTAAPAVQPPVSAPATNTQPAATRATATPAATPAVKAAAARPGNGATLNSRGTASTRPMSQVVVDTLKGPGGRAQSATPAPIAADDAIMRMMPQMDVKLGSGEDGGLRLNGTVGIVVMMGLLTLLPTLLLMMTGFTRILIVLHFLKQAMGTQSAPPAHLLAGMALLLTGFVMTPTLTQVNREAITPWLDGQMTQVEMMKTGVKPMRAFMLRQTRESDLKTFVEMSRMPRPATVDDVPLHVLMSAFVASELRTAFQIGFAIYLPFIIIDAVVASVLMSMGMFMLPPAMISLPFKLLLFVLVDGWSLTITSLVQSFK